MGSYNTEKREQGSLNILGSTDRGNGTEEGIKLIVFLVPGQTWIILFWWWIRA